MGILESYGKNLDYTDQSGSVSDSDAKQIAFEKSMNNTSGATHHQPAGYNDNSNS